MRHLRFIYSLVGTVFVLSACNGTEPGIDTAASRAGLVSGAGDAELVIVDEWPTGYCARVDIENTGSEDITSWTVVIDANDGSINNLWKGQRSGSGSLITVTPYAYNSAIPGGRTADFGFCGVKAGDTQLPTLVSLEVEGGDAGGTGGTGGTETGGTETGGTETGGTETGGTETGGTETGGTETGGTGGTTEPPSPLIAELVVTTDWSSGFCASVSLRNTGDSDLSAWSVVLSTPNATVNNLWNGSYVVAGEMATVAPLAYNSVIRPGNEVGFGFCAVTTGADHTPVLVSAEAEGEEGTGSGGTGSGGTGSGGTGSGGTGSGGTGSGGTPGTGGTENEGGSTGDLAGTGGGGNESPVTVSMSMQSDWGSGYCAAFVVSNVSSDEISSWTVDVSVPNATIANLWDGVTTDPSPGVVSISAADYNDLILPGAAATFGYCALTSRTPYLPSIVSVEAE